MLIFELIEKIRFWKASDRIGPDIPLTHWMLNFKSTMLRLCKKKFHHFGEKSEIRAGAYLIGCSQIYIGSRVIIRPNCMFFAENENLVEIYIKIEDDVMIGAGVHIYTNNHRFDRLDVSLIDQGYYPASGVTLKKGCWIGANSILLPGVSIGVNAVIGAGSVVTKSIPDAAIAVGNPAKVIRFVGDNKIL
jgi:acetyltransferase-like isoleucine patch superfamily enzyme